MKTKKIITLALAAAMVSASALSVSAGTLTETNTTGQTEVTARIDGTTPVPGDVTYVITIPDVVDFGTLTQPENTDKDSFKDVPYSVSLTEVNNLDVATQKIAVYVRDQNASVGNSDFKITNKADSTKSFTYDIYDVLPENITATKQSINANSMTQAAGYKLCDFTTQGDAVDGTLRLNQTQLCGYDIADIVGDYSGYMVFLSTIENA